VFCSDFSSPQGLRSNSRSSPSSTNSKRSQSSVTEAISDLFEDGDIVQVKKAKKEDPFTFLVDVPLWPSKKSWEEYAKQNRLYQLNHNKVKIEEDGHLWYTRYHYTCRNHVDCPVMVKFQHIGEGWSTSTRGVHSKTLKPFTGSV